MYHSINSTDQMSGILLIDNVVILSLEGVFLRTIEERADISKNDKMCVIFSHAILFLCGSFWNGTGPGICTSHNLKKEKNRTDMSNGKALRHSYQ